MYRTVASYCRSDAFFGGGKALTWQTFLWPIVLLSSINFLMVLSVSCPQCDIIHIARETIYSLFPKNEIRFKGNIFLSSSDILS